MEEKFKNKLNFNLFKHVVNPYIKDNKELFHDDYFIQITESNIKTMYELKHFPLAEETYVDEAKDWLNIGEFIYFSINGKPIGVEEFSRLSSSQLMKRNPKIYWQEEMLDDIEHEFEADESLSLILFYISLLSIMEIKEMESH